MPVVESSVIEHTKLQQSFRCPYCGNISNMVWVHGHGQCMHCKTNVDECCRGEGAACTVNSNAATPGNLNY